MNCVIILWLLCIVSDSASEQLWNFEDNERGKALSDFYFDETGEAPKGKWRIILDEGNHVLAQLDRSEKHSRNALAVVRSSSYEDVRVSVRIRVMEGDIDRTGGLVWRYKNSENYLLARLDASDKRVCLYRFVNGNRIKFGEEEHLNIRTGEWYNFRIEHVGSKIKVYLDGEAVLQERDRHFTHEGKIGLWTKSDSMVHFDELQVQKLQNRHGDH